VSGYGQSVPEFSRTFFARIRSRVVSVHTVVRPSRLPVFVVEVDTRYPFRVTDKKQVGVLGEVVRLGIEI
ncbi:hypothetical protein N9L76_09850, partial [bacterium]|nr:hypothetical protein [bacterium]